MNDNHVARSRAHVTLQIDDLDSPVDALNLLALKPFIDGDEPYSRSTQLQRVRTDHPLLPEGVTAVREARDNWRHLVVARGDGWTLRVLRRRGANATVCISARTKDIAEEMLERATAGAIEPAPAPEVQLSTFGFWFSGRGPQRRERTLDVTDWAAIRRNYTGRVAAAFDEIMVIGPDDVNGRLLLLHGPPGTGKTTALRALTWSWREWCQVDYVLDPERLFADAEYLMTVAFDADDDDQATPWRMLVLEDCDELIRAHAKERAGQALARLLNMADGLPGQGVRLLLAITTNEPLAALHPAIVRPGRCLAQIEVGRLDRAEAGAWLGRPAGCGAEGMTLAELFVRRGELRVVEQVDAAPAVGQYL